MCSGSESEDMAVWLWLRVAAEGGFLWTAGYWILIQDFLQPTADLVRMTGYHAPFVRYPRRRQLPEEGQKAE